MNTKIRAFLAIEIPKAIAEKISDTQKFLKKSDADVKWVPPENFHYNLKFFGYITQDMLEQIISKTKEVVSSIKHFEIEIKEIGGFPTLNSPRVIWMGMGKGEDEIKELAEKLEHGYSKIGIEKEEREFRAHLTLGRLRSNDNKKELVEKAKQKQSVHIGAFKADEIVLFRSKLSRKGPTYEKIETFKLS